MKALYKLANSIRRIYWFIFRPHTRGVKCLVQTDGSYLLIQTSYSGKCWTLPGGGIQPRELVEDAARREVREEVGVVLNEIKILGSYESSAEYKRDTIYLTYAEILNQDIAVHTGEVSVARWFPMNALPQEQSRALRESLALVR